MSMNITGNFGFDCITGLSPFALPAPSMDAMVVEEETMFEEDLFKITDVPIPLYVQLVNREIPPFPGLEKASKHGPQVHAMAVDKMSISASDLLIPSSISSQGIRKP